MVIEDVLHDARTASHAENFAESLIRSIVCVPLFEQGRISAVMMLLEEQPRAWLDEDISFIREVADRARTADERMRANAHCASEEQFRTLADNMSQFARMADPPGASTGTTSAGTTTPAPPAKPCARWGGARSTIPIITSGSAPR